MRSSRRTPSAAARWSGPRPCASATSSRVSRTWTPTTTVGTCARFSFLFFSISLPTLTAGSPARAGSRPSRFGSELRPLPDEGAAIAPRPGCLTVRPITDSDKT